MAGAESSRRHVLARLAGIGATAVLPAACGFHLRGAVKLPFTTLWSGLPAGTALAGEFNRQVRVTQSTRLVEKPEDAQARFEVLSLTRESEIMAFTSTGRPRQYQLRLRLRYRLTDGGSREFTPPTEIMLRRDISTTDTQLISRADEEAQLYRDMERDLVVQLMRRLSLVQV